MLKAKIALFFLFMLWLSSLCAQDYYNQKRFRFENYIYSENIGTVQLFRSDSDLSLPVIQHNSGQVLTLLFDEVNTTPHTFQYTYIHCDPNWNPSPLNTSQYLGGYLEDRILTYQYSLNTAQRFVHYSLNFPTRDMYPLIAGNYLLKVYPEGDPEHVVITRRFQIVDQVVEVDPIARRSTKIEDRFQKQEVVFTINYPNYDQILNPVEEVQVVLMQNDRWDNAIFNLKPQFVKNQQLVYQYEQGNQFDGGNEYRPLDLRTNRYAPPGTKNLSYEADKRYHYYLQIDKARYNQPYTVYPDINGRYRINTRDLVGDVNLESDYSAVHFSLVPDPNYDKEKVYIVGQFNNYNPSDDYSMQLNDSTGRLEATLYLKQGYYNYMYATLQKASVALSPAKIEGNFSDTENDYSIFVYHKPIGLRYYKLISYTTFKSFNR